MLQMFPYIVENFVLRVTAFPLLLSKPSKEFGDLPQIQMTQMDFTTFILEKLYYVTDT